MSRHDTPIVLRYICRNPEEKLHIGEIAILVGYTGVNTKYDKIHLLTDVARTIRAQPPMWESVWAAKDSGYELIVPLIMLVKEEDLK